MATSGYHVKVELSLSRVVFYCFKYCFCAGFCVYFGWTVKWKLCSCCNMYCYRVSVKCSKIILLPLLKETFFVSCWNYRLSQQEYSNFFWAVKTHRIVKYIFIHLNIYIFYSFYELPCQHYSIYLFIPRARDMFVTPTFGFFCCCRKCVWVSLRHIYVLVN